MTAKATKRRPLIFAIAFATLMVGSLIPATASFAGTYDVYSCRIPYGAKKGDPAPVEVASSPAEAEGKWSYNASGSVLESQTCATGGEVVGALQAGVAHSDADIATWEFSAPEGVDIHSGFLWQATDAQGGEGYLTWLATPTDPGPASAAGSPSFIDGCVYVLGCRGVGDTAEPLSPQNEVAIPPENTGGSHLYINASCSKASCPSSSGDKEGYAAVIHLYAADLQLEENAAPVVSSVSGELATSPTISGEPSVHFRALDEGSGVYQATIRVDGAVVQQNILDEEEGRCKPIETAPDGRPAFLSAKPCPREVEGDLSIQTKSFTNGAHTLSITVSNAAGEEATVLDRTIDVQNASSSQAGEASPPQSSSSGAPGSPQGGATPLQSPLGAGMLNGRDASSPAHLSAAWLMPRSQARRASRGAGNTDGGASPLGGPTLLSPFGRVHIIVGRLMNGSGKPISGAEIEVSVIRSFGGARPTMLAPLRTNDSGRFRLRLARTQPTSRITLTYASTADGPTAAQAALTLKVEAGVALTVRPKTTSVGHTIKLSGRLLGGPIPQGGKQIVLQAKSKGTPWLTFDVLRTNRRGRFQATHRFRLPGPIRYRFRAVSLHEADFPYVRGQSNVVSVWER